MLISANCDCDFQAEFCDNFRRKCTCKKEEVTTSEEVPSIHAVKVDASAKEEVATSEEVPPIHAVKSSASHP